jgi:plasmid maintenance system antidote protein VapI
MKYKLRKEPLTKWKEREGRTYTWLARRLGLKPDTLVNQIGGRVGVSLATVLKLEKELGIPARDLVEAV